MTKHKTGQNCPTTGQWKFDSYVDAPAGTASPTKDERVIPLERDETFPPIKSTEQGAWWTLLRAS